MNLPMRSVYHCTLCDKDFELMAVDLGGSARGEKCPGAAAGGRHRFIRVSRAVGEKESER